MNHNLTMTERMVPIPLAGETETSSAEEQPARDSQPGVTDYHAGGSLRAHRPTQRPRMVIQNSLVPKKTLACRRQDSKNGNKSKQAFVQFTLNRYSWTLKVANEINNSGWIVGDGINPQGEIHAFVLVPEPGTFGLFSLGISSLRKRSRRSQSGSDRQEDSRISSLYL